ncbi:MAG: transposase, partial [Thaumarchaeota archaeon]|nr:transposase [Nitrososphaerota archaeon]
MRLDKAFQAFFASLTKYPKFKRKGRYNSFTYPQWVGLRINGNRLKLSRIGSVKVKLHREIVGTPKRCTIIRGVDQWFACIMVEQEEPVAVTVLNAKPPVGVDLGVANLAVLSDGTVFPNPKHLSHSLNRIKTLQQSLSKKREGSHNREKTKVLLAKAWRRVRRQRDDTAHKVSRLLADNYSTIVFEELKIPNMVKNHHLASAIMDSAWGKLRTLTAYKAERLGGRVAFVDPIGTSQRCSGCGEVVPKELSMRVHRCPCCGLTVDRDVNAARNILERG